MKKCFLFMLLALPYWVNAQIGAQATMEFLRLPNAAKINALGSAAIALPSNELAFGIANPALLQAGMDRQLSLNHALLFAGIQHGTVAYARYNKKHDITAYGGLQYINYGRMQGTDETGALTNKFSCSEYAFSAGFGKTLANRFSYGVNAKWIASYFDQASSYAVATDLGVAYNDTSKKLGLSLLIKNAGLQLSSYNARQFDETATKELLPIDVQFGLSKRLAHLPLTLSVVVHHLQQFNIRYDNPNDHIISVLNTDADTTKNFFERTHLIDKIARHIILGGNFHLSKVLDVQVGYNHLRRMELKTTDRAGLIGFSAGFTVHTQKFSIGYSRSYFYLPSANNMISFYKTIPARKARIQKLA